MGRLPKLSCECHAGEVVFFSTFYLLLLTFKLPLTGRFGRSSIF